MKEFKNIEFSSDDIRIVYEGAIADELGRITREEMIDLLTDFAINNNIQKADDIIKMDDVLILKDHGAYKSFKDEISPRIQKRIDSFKEEQSSNHFNLKKLYIYEDILEAEYFIQFEDDTIKKISKDEALEEMKKYARENNLSVEQIEQMKIIEQIDKEQSLALNYQMLNQQSGDEDDDLAIAYFLIYQDQETGEIKGRIYYQNDTSEEKTETEIQEEIKRYMEENGFESEEELEKEGILVKVFPAIDNLDIEKFYYYFPNDDEENEEAKGMICYQDGTIEEVSKKELADKALSYMEANNIEELYELHQLGKLDKISEKEAKAILKKYNKSYNKQPEIGKIVFFSYINAKKEIVTRARVYYTDGNYTDISRSEAEEEILNIKKENKIKSTEQLFEENFLECVTADDLEHNHENYREQASNEKKKEHKIIKWISNKLKTNKIVKWISIGLATLIAMGTASCTYKLVQNSIIGNIKNQDNNEFVSDQDGNENVLNNDMEREDFSVYSYDELIQRCKTNPSRQNAMKTIYNFITAYNINSAYTYKEEESSTKLSHTLDEVSAMYLLYNNISPETVNEIYQQTNFTASQLRNDLINAQKQDSLAHNLQTSTLSKDHLFIEKKDKEFYNKYEKIFNKMNDTSNYEKKKEYKTAFYDTLRKDFSGMSTNSYKNIDSSKIVIVEFVDAMKRVKIDVDNKLTDQEEKYINGILENVVDQKIKDIATKQVARNIEETADYGDGKIIDTNPYYSEFKDAIVKELESKHAYYTTEENRDVTDYKRFKRNTKPKQDKKEETVEKEEPKVNHNQSTSTKKSSPIQSTSPSVPALTPTITDNIQPQEEIVEVKKRVEIIEEFSNEAPKRDKIDDNIEYPDSNDIVTPDDATEVVDTTIPPKNTLTPSIDTGIEEITPEDVNQTPDELIPSEIENSKVEFVSPDDAQTDDSMINETIIEFDSDKIDEYGNLNDQYTDVTTDLNTVYQTNNSEIIADYIINQMEQQTDSYVEEENLVK